MFTALTAFGGSAALLSATDGSNLGIELESLEGSPFNDYLVPGLLLGLVVGGSNVVGAAMVWRKTRFADEAAFAAGAVVFGWISIQVLILGEVIYFHWLYWALGLLTMAAALRLWFAARRTAHIAAIGTIGGTQ